MRDITYIASYPKSGVTWLNYMLFHALFDGDVERLNQDFIYTTNETLNRVPADKPAFLQCHWPYSEKLPLYTRAAKCVYLVRDPIDVMLSVWDFRHLHGAMVSGTGRERDILWVRFTKEWLDGVSDFPYAGAWKANVESWLDQDALPALFVGYERLKANTLPELERITRFLGYALPRARVERAVAASSVKAMKKQETEEIAARRRGVFYLPERERGYEIGYRFVGQLHTHSAQYWLTPAQRRQADAMFGETIKRVAERVR